MKNIFREGAISPAFIADSISKHSQKLGIGGHSIFLGQIRQDKIAESEVESIEYSAHTEMANELAHQIREETFAKYNLTCMHIYHSLGEVKAGEICLFVFTSSPHRHDCQTACNELVERIKKELPIWGKEILSNASHQWKVNQ
ncbi:MAG: molybdenum cofactor biosynthesis protein MoaE [Bacteroidia bacterium]